MKHILSAILACSVFFCSAQHGTDPAPPFKRFPTVPPFRLLNTDSVSFFTKADLKKNRPLLLIMFDPSCDHCKHQTAEIVKHIDEFEKIQVVMSSFASVAAIREFSDYYGLARHKNIHVGKDYQNLFPGFFLFHNLPYQAMYDKKGNLITTFEGSMKIEDLLKTFDK